MLTVNNIVIILLSVTGIILISGSITIVWAIIKGIFSGDKKRMIIATVLGIAFLTFAVSILCPIIADMLK